MNCVEKVEEVEEVEKVETVEKVERDRRLMSLDAFRGFDMFWIMGGETLACGTGACATVAAAVINGLLPAEKDIDVTLRGGTLKIKCDKGYEMIMTGPATLVFEGVYEYKN